MEEVPWVHKDECFLFKGFFLNHLPSNIRTHLMREDISNPRKLAAKADEIWQSSFPRSVNTVSATSRSPPGCDDYVNALCQSAQPRPASHVAPRPAPRASHPLSSSTTSDLCWYHCKHSDQAQHCRTLFRIAGSKFFLEGLFPDSNSPCRHSKDHQCHPLWPL